MIQNNKLSNGMRIGIDVSQIAYGETGVSNYLVNLIRNLLSVDKKNEYVFFFSSLRKNLDLAIFNVQSSPTVSIKIYKIPPILLDII